MGIWVADLESDGLVDQATRVWCGVFKNIETQEVRAFTPENIDEMLVFMNDIIFQFRMRKSYFDLSRPPFDPSRNLVIILYSTFIFVKYLSIFLKLKIKYI